jgi:hypothetical protein
VFFILTYNDFAALGNNERERREFILRLIKEHKDSELYRTAVDADLYYRLQNPTIMHFQKLVYNIYGKAVPDIWSPNHKIPSNWYHYFTVQAVGHLLSNGVFFEKEDTKNKLGKNFDRTIIKLATEARNGAVSFGFWNNDHVDAFSVREFAPLYDEFTGNLMTGVRFWQLGGDKPLMMTLYEPDGVTAYVKPKDGEVEEFSPKRSYKKIVTTTKDGMVYAQDGGNYNGFPIVPLYHPLRQSDIVGNRNVIDAYDLIASGLINNTDEGNFIYWILKNCDGMSAEDDEKFIEQIRINRVAHANGDDGAAVDAHTVETPVDAHKFSLEELRSLLFTNFMGVDVQKISTGNTTATEIRAAYEPLNWKNDMFEGCVTEFIERILSLAGIDDVPTYKRSQLVNVAEETETVLSAANYLDTETVLKKLPFITVDEVSGILERMEKAETDRFDNNIDDEGDDVDA